jgi:hypothetical protein
MLIILNDMARGVHRILRQCLAPVYFVIRACIPPGCHGPILKNQTTTIRISLIAISPMNERADLTASLYLSSFEETRVTRQMIFGLEGLPYSGSWNGFCKTYDT